MCSVNGGRWHLCCVLSFCRELTNTNLEISNLSPFWPILYPFIYYEDLVKLANWFFLYEKQPRKTDFSYTFLPIFWPFLSTGVVKNMPLKDLLTRFENSLILYTESTIGQIIVTYCKMKLAVNHVAEIYVVEQAINRLMFCNIVS